MKYILSIHLFAVSLAIGCTQTQTPMTLPVQSPSVVKSTPGASPSPVIMEVTQSDSVNQIRTTASRSKCFQYSFKNRGRAPSAYLEGIALSYARAVCNPGDKDVVLVSSARQQPETTYDSSDVTSWYRSNFTRLGYSNDTAGIDTLTNVYTILIGLGMMESSGRHCCGRDMSAGFSTSDAAEAGAFQTSWGARSLSVALPELFDIYKIGKRKCNLSVWSNGVRCSQSDERTWGYGLGASFQQMAKFCPAFGADYAAVLLRTHGGTKGEFGPIRIKAVEIVPACHDMLSAVREIIQTTPSVCQVL